MTSYRSTDLNLLKVFEALMAEGNVTRAARKLSLTQPTVSNALRRLRVTYDDPLFVRSGAGVKPTRRAIDLWGRWRSPCRRSAAPWRRAALTRCTAAPA
ncbi:LysR family transcriptional regulator [Verminephrobacter aporrectodeae]|uniref:LysR family transcriptional regulator n=1 Tax=Verminephrobacter aporrectodeae TaxID=1110389 RepID=UPI001F002160|nr:LysR family transcriptional regulator [Verminephrobacter aporrectodeae]